MLHALPFEVCVPESLEEAIQALAQPGARVLAGGTDLVPNLKHHLSPPRVVVDLSRLDALRTLEVRGEVLRVGALVTLDTLATDPRVRAWCPSLAHAASVVASPILRKTATLGGNLHLEPRCRYVNQTPFWRSALGGCLKSEGSVCWVVPKGRNCVAALSSDLVPVLVALSAEAELQREGSSRRVGLEAYYRADGTCHTDRRPDELLTWVDVPALGAQTRTMYVKWSVRESIDFPLVSAAVRLDLSADAGDPVLERVRVVVGVLGARPRIVDAFGDILGQRLGAPGIAEGIADVVFSQCRPLENVPYDAAFRREMLRVQVRRAVLQLASRSGPEASSEAPVSVGWRGG